LPGERVDLGGRVARIREETKSAAQAQHRLGGANSSRSLDAGDRRLEEDAGQRWDKAYTASNTIYVARQNNILFSVLAQYFGRRPSTTG